MNPSPLFTLCLCLTSVIVLGQASAKVATEISVHIPEWLKTLWPLLGGSLPFLGKFIWTRYWANREQVQQLKLDKSSDVSQMATALAQLSSAERERLAEEWGELWDRKDEVTASEVKILEKQMGELKCNLESTTTRLAQSDANLLRSENRVRELEVLLRKRDES